MIMTHARAGPWSRLNVVGFETRYDVSSGLAVPLARGLR
jgi:hypothetical protein